MCDQIKILRLWVYIDDLNETPDDDDEKKEE